MADVAIQESGDSERKEIIDRIREDVAELGRASPSGAETLHARIDGELQRLLMSPQERALKMPHPNEGTNPRAAGRNPSGPLTPPGVAFPVGVAVKDRSEDGSRAPVPVAPADPDDVHEWQRGQITPKGEVKPVALVPKSDPDAEKRRLEEEAAELARVHEQQQQNDAGKPEENRKQAELDEEARRRRDAAGMPSAKEPVPV